VPGCALDRLPSVRQQMRYSYQVCGVLLFLSQAPTSIKKIFSTHSKQCAQIRRNVEDTLAENGCAVSA
jgi:hypothetical protein